MLDAFASGSLRNPIYVKTSEEFSTNGYRDRVVSESVSMSYPSGDRVASMSRPSEASYASMSCPERCPTMIRKKK